MSFPIETRARRIHTHKLEALVAQAELDVSLKEAERTNPELKENWSTVRDWPEQSRYEPPSRLEAENLAKAIGDRRHGVLRWLRQHM
jgi:hypothetical protein